ncbi:MAG: (2Fe-2S)-binding protein [Caldisericia bacterium]|nr:(2Fe-2S)-binding protein [Caldisericia bacterium]
MRIKEHPILEFKKSKKVTFFFDGKPIEGHENEPIAVALFEHGYKQLSESLVSHRSRGIFCCIGNCSSCLMKVDGMPNVRTCTKRIKSGMQVETQKRSS